MVSALGRQGQEIALECSHQNLVKDELESGLESRPEEVKLGCSGKTNDTH